MQDIYMENVYSIIDNDFVQLYDGNLDMKNITIA